MSDEARLWCQYADENRRSALVLLGQSLFNPCLQNAQQAVEKYLKALLLKHELPLRRTHSIQELALLLRESRIDVPLSDDDIELLDSIYLPSKYPVGSALPDFVPGEEVCRRCIALAEMIRATVEKALA